MRNVSYVEQAQKRNALGQHAAGEQDGFEHKIHDEPALRQYVQLHLSQAVARHGSDAHVCVLLLQNSEPRDGTGKGRDGHEMRVADQQAAVKGVGGGRV